MLPMAAISMLDDEEFGPPAVEVYDDPEVRDVPAEANRQQVARGFHGLMGGELDADGVAADLVDTGGDMAMWGVNPSSESFGIVPDIGDWTDPKAWLDRVDELDLPGELESGIERLARAAARRMESEGEEAVRRDFARRLGDMLRQAGIDVLAVKTQQGLDWMVLNQEDFAREQDGEPWSPPAGAPNTLEPRDIGVSLGRGGHVRVWPTDAAPADRPPAAAAPAASAAPPAARPPAAAAPSRSPPPPPPPPPARRSPGGSGMVS